MVPFEATELRFPGFLGRRSLRRRSTAKALSTYLMVFQLLLSGLSAVAYNSVKKNGLLSWLHFRLRFRLPAIKGREQHS